MQLGRLPSSKRRKNPTRKAPLQFPLLSQKILPFLASRKAKVSLNKSTKRRRSDSNRCIKVLQTGLQSAAGLHLGFNQFKSLSVMLPSPPSHFHPLKPI